MSGPPSWNLALQQRIAISGGLVPSITAHAKDQAKLVRATRSSFEEKAVMFSNVTLVIVGRLYHALTPIGILHDWHECVSKGWVASAAD
jgi:hypothetical protein